APKWIGIWKGPAMEVVCNKLVPQRPNVIMVIENVAPPKPDWTDAIPFLSKKKPRTVTGMLIVGEGETARGRLTSTMDKNNKKCSGATSPIPPESEIKAGKFHTVLYPIKIDASIEGSGLRLQMGRVTPECRPQGFGGDQMSTIVHRGNPRPMVPPQHHK